MLLFSLGKHSNPPRSLHISPLPPLKSDGCLIFPTKKLWTPNPPHPKMMDPNLPPNDGSRRIQRRCESGTNVSQLRGCGDPSVKMRNNYAIITPQTSHQMHPFAHKMRNFGEDGKEKWNHGKKRYARKEKYWDSKSRRRSLSNPEQLI